MPETRKLITGLMREVEVLAKVGKVKLDAYVVSQSLVFLDKAASHIKASMQLDVETGHRSELDALIGVISNKGRGFGIPTPMADMICATLLPIELIARGIQPSL